MDGKSLQSPQYVLHLFFKKAWPQPGFFEETKGGDIGFLSADTVIFLCRPLYAFLFHSNTFGKIAGFIDIAVPGQGDIITQQLHRHYFQRRH